MAGGGAIWERLDAAADLVQMGRVPVILLMRDDTPGQYSFTANRTWTKTEWMSAYLVWRGVSANRVRWIFQSDGYFGTLKEAQAVSRSLPVEVKRLVLVSSAPHMRRCILALSRSLPAGVQVVPYAATDTLYSYEMHHPVWLEYLKLLVYCVIS